MNLLNDIITYVRRIIKSPNDNDISTGLIIDYINRFWINDVDGIFQLFDLKTKYAFQTSPGMDQYNMPLYDVQVESPNDNPQNINFYPVYQGFLGPCYINGIQVPLQTQKNSFFNIWPNVVQNFPSVGVGDGGANYSLQVPNISGQISNNPPINSLLRGHIDIAGIISTGNNQDPPMTNTFINTIPVTSVFPAIYITAIGENGCTYVVTDSGQFFIGNCNLGLLINPGKAPFGNTQATGGYFVQFPITNVTLGTTTVIDVVNTFEVGDRVVISDIIGTTELNGNTYTIITATAIQITIDVDSTTFTPYGSGGFVNSFQNFVNYLTGEINVTFPVGIPQGNNINVQCYFFQSGLPRAILFYNNVLTLRSVPAQSYLVELDAYLSPSAFLTSSDAIQFGYMSEFIARGAARKILADTNDEELLTSNEKFFLEQKSLVQIRSQRQWTATRTETIYSQGFNQGQSGFNSLGGNT